MFKITLAQGYSITTMLAVAAAAVLPAGAFYWRAFRGLRPWQWQALLALRIAAILLIVLLLFRPVFSLSKDVRQRPALVFLLDRSASMSIADGATGVSRFNQARGQIEKWWDRLGGDFDLHLLEFAEQARPLEGPQDLASLRPDGKATSLCRAMATAAKQFPPPGAEALVLLSDGIHNSAGDPVDAASKLGLVVHAIGVGASLRDDVSCRDVQVTAIDCPERLLLNNIAHITGSIQGIGLAGRVIQVVLEEDGRQIAQSELTLQSREGPQQVAFDFRPSVKGQHTYTVRAVPVPEEKIVENNQRSATASVVEPGIRVLYIEGTLRAEYGALVDRFLAKDPDLEFCALVQTRPNVFLRRSNMEGLRLSAIPGDQETVNRFDVFIFGDLDHSYIRPGQQEMIVKRVRDGAGLMMLGGYHSLGPGGYDGEPLGQILPVRLGGLEIGQITEPLLPVLTPDGSQHPIFANIRDFFPTRLGEPRIAGLPKLDGCTRVEGPRPGATVLATLTADAASMPLLAVQPVDRGRTAVFCGDTTRNWQQGPRALDQESPFLRFWGQTVRWLAGHAVDVAAGASLTAGTDKSFYQPDEPIGISAVVRDPQGQAAVGAKVTARVRSPTGHVEQLALSAVAGPGGHYSGRFQSGETGSHEIVVEAQVGALGLAAGKIVVELGRPNLEFEKLDLDEKMLMQIAVASRGRYFHITTADSLIEQLDRTQKKKNVAIEQPLYSPPLCWLLFVGALTGEWLLRRRFQLR